MSAWELLNVCVREIDLVKKVNIVDRKLRDLCVLTVYCEIYKVTLLSPTFGAAFRGLHCLLSFIIGLTPAPLYSPFPTFLGDGVFILV